MKKMLLAVLLLAFGISATAEARVYRMTTLVKRPELATKFNVAEDGILFRHDTRLPYNLIYRMKDGGVQFRVDNGAAANPRYTELGTVNINIGKAEVLKYKTGLGTVVRFQ